VGAREIITRQDVDLVLDIGAAHGTYGRWIREAGYEGRICSFEPLSKPFRLLSAMASTDPLWTCRRVALGAEPGTAEMNVAGNSLSSSLLPMAERHKRSAPESVYVGTETVEVRTLDEVWDEIVGDARKPYLKIDVQGYELEVLRGAERALPNVHGVQAELSLVPLYVGAPAWSEVIEYLQGRGFHPSGIEPAYSDPKTGETLQIDGIFTRDVA